MRSLISQELFLMLVQLLQTLKVGWILRYEGTFLEELKLIVQTLLMCELLNICHEIRIWDVRERVTDSVAY